MAGSGQEARRRELPTCRSAILQSACNRSVTCASCALASLALVVASPRCSARAHRAPVRPRPVVRRSARRTCRARARRVADLDTRRVTEREITIPTAARADARAALRAGAVARARGAADVGPAPSGIDEPRLVRLARQICRERHRRRHARHSRAVALRDRAGDHRRDRGRRRAGSPSDAGARAGSHGRR